MSQTLITSSSADSLCETTFEKLANVEDVSCVTTPISTVTTTGERVRSVNGGHQQAGREEGGVLFILYFLPFFCRLPHRPPSSTTTS